MKAIWIRKSILFPVLAGTVLAGYGQQPLSVQEEEAPLAPKEYRRPEGYDPVPYRYPYSLSDMKEKFSEPTMALADREYQRMMEVIEKGTWKATGESIDRHPVPEWFRDLKFGMLYDWGLWSLGAYATRMEHEAMYPDWYEYRMVDDSRPYKSNHISMIPYHHKNWGKDFERGDFIPLFTAEDYHPDELTDLAVKAGMKYIIPFCKHFSGFCIWPSSYTHMDAGDRLGRDLIQPLADQCRKKGLKFGFYYCTQEWEYPVIGDGGELLCRTWFRGNTTVGKYEPSTLSGSPLSGKTVSIQDWENIIPGKIPVKDFLKQYLVPQAVEFIDRYDPDIVWYDGEWTDPVEKLGSYEITAYFYNQAGDRKEVAVNDRLGQVDHRGLRKKRGDIFTSEYGYPPGGIVEKKPWMEHAWEENRSISPSFGFNWQDTEENVLSPRELVHMFVNIVAAGGNLLLIISPDGRGALPEIQKTRLEEIGKWLKVNGEGIYYTRAWSTVAEDHVRYTRAKDGKTIYAIALEWPGTQLELKSVKPAEGSEICLLGCEKPLEWHHRDGTTAIILPEALQKESGRPCRHAYTFRIRL
ncbi:MAG: alpha-L-fucosidase [Tannerella sp.]|jgi:alpha-L-fucosidase|nr:alpha-L-fucosidase [Tannerella sp.]